jgi:hypothetical protein
MYSRTPEGTTVLGHIIFRHLNLPVSVNGISVPKYISANVLKVELHVRSSASVICY